MTTQENRDLRQFETMQVLAHSETGRLARPEIWQAVVARVPLEGDEADPTASSSMPRGEKNFQWASAELVNAGFMIKAARGEWAITDSGRAALAAAPDVVAFASESRSRSQTYLRERDEKIELAMGTSILPPDSGAEAVRRASLLFRERGLRDQGSVFSSGRSVWRGDVARELVRRVVEQPDVAGETFIEKLSTQLDGASDDAILLMAELVAWQVLPLLTPGEAKKRERITTVLGWMTHAVMLPVDVEAALRNGSFNPGVGLSTRIWQGLCLVINTLVRWSDMTDDDRARVLDDPWEWRDLVNSIPGDEFPTQRNELLYLVHPGTFGEVVSKENRRSIRDAFIGELASGATDDVDRDLLEITIALQAKSHGPAPYYREPLKSIWQRAELDVPVLDPATQRPSEVEVSLVERVSFPASGPGLAASLHLDEAWLDRTLRLIERRKQVIFYGPPGTGKTYLARALARHVTDSTSGETSIVQFHPTYSYEDFFEGFRPSTGVNGEQLGFSLRRGPLRRLADAAAANPEANYFLVIDEINRGNLAKIFGELYYLLEYRDSEISLLYSDEPFTLPSNIFFIGTMNTADRSIAMLDAAMRRRFAFVELHPETVPVEGLLARWMSATGVIDDRADLLTALNRAIPDHDSKIGPSFLMRDLADEGVGGVWTFEILPLLAEYHYADGTDVAARYGVEPLRRAIRSSTPTIEPVQDGQPDDAPDA